MTSPTTRERLVAAAADAFMRQGFAATGLKELCLRSEASVGSLYHFFPGGKDDLAAETLRAAGAAYMARVAEVVLGTDDVVAGVRACFTGAAATLRDGDFADACPIATVALEVASTDDRLRRVTAEVFASWLDGLEVWLRAGGVPADRCRPLAATVLAALEGGFLLSRAARDTTALEAIGESMAALVAGALGRAA